MQISLQCFHGGRGLAPACLVPRYSQPPPLQHQTPSPRNQDFWILGKTRKRLGLWMPGSQGSPAGQRGRGGAGMQRVGSCLRHLILACPAAVLLAASPNAPQSQPRGSIEGTGRGKGILSGKLMGQIVQVSLLSLLSRLCSDQGCSPPHPRDTDRETEDRHAPLTHQHWHLALTPAPAGPQWPCWRTPPSSPTHRPQVMLRHSTLPALHQSLQGGKEIPTPAPRILGVLPSSLDP